MTTEVNNPSALEEQYSSEDIMYGDVRLADLTLEELVERITSDLLEGQISGDISTSKLKKIFDDRLTDMRTLEGQERVGEEEQAYIHKLLSVWNTLHLEDKPEEVRLKALNKVRVEYRLSKLSRMVADLSIPFEQVCREAQELSDQLVSVTPIDAEVAHKSQAHLCQLRGAMFRRSDVSPERVAEEHRANLARREDVLSKLEALLSESDVELAYEEYKKLLGLWQNLGSISSEDKERISQKFRDLKGQVRAYVQAVTSRLEREAEANAQAKEAICKRIEELTSNLSEGSTKDQWQVAYEEVLSTRDEWAVIGDVPSTLHKELQHRFQLAHEAFFVKLRGAGVVVRGKDIKSLDQRRELVERVLALKDSTDWKTTAEAIKKIQGEWKLIGGVPNAEHQKLWQEFSEATNYFFERRKSAYESARRGHTSVKQQKEQILVRLQELLSGDEEHLSDGLKSCKEAWQAFPPASSRVMRELHESYRELVGKVHQRIRQGQRDKARLEGYKARLNRLDGASDIKDESRKLRQLLGNAERELKTFDDNLGRFAALASSNYAGGLSNRRQELEREVERLKEQLRMLEEHSKEGK